MRDPVLAFIPKICYTPQYIGKIIQFMQKKKILAIAGLALFLGAFVGVAEANHSWGGYHWARTANPFTVKLGDNVTSAWDATLNTASADWSLSSVLDTTIVVGNTSATKGKNTPKNCLPTNGRVEVCNSAYGNNGWLGIASISISGGHITQGTVKLNDTYFNTAKYNTPAWRKLVVCQEVGHTFGLDHQDEIFANPNLGTCMDYTNDPTGTTGTNGSLDNEHPNQHDYDELETIYAHLDTTNTSSASVGGTGKPAQVGSDGDLNDSSTWGTEVRKDAHGKNSVYERDLGGGKKLVTFVVWAE